MREPQQLSFFCASKRESEGAVLLTVTMEVNSLFPYL